MDSAVTFLQRLGILMMLTYRLFQTNCVLTSIYSLVLTLQCNHSSTVKTYKKFLGLEISREIQ